MSGASYDITKTRFDFGAPIGPPKYWGPTDGGIDASALSYLGPNGEVFIQSNGVEGAITHADANEDRAAGAALDLPDWSTDTAKLQAHAISYWAAMGVETCQLTAVNQPGSPVDVRGTSDTSLSQGIAITLDRSIGGVPLPDSKLSAHFNASDTTTAEDFFWPEIPADAVSAALAFAKTLGDPTNLAAYRAKLPANSQGLGVVTLHHSTEGGIGTPFQTVVSYDVPRAPDADSGDGYQLLSYDTDGNRVGLPL